MQKSLITLINGMAATLMLLGSALAQQTPATTTQPSSAAGSQNASPLATQKDKVSYAIGMNIGNNLHRQSLDVDPKLLQKGLEDAMSGGKTLLSEDEARATLTQLQGEMREKQQAKMQQAGEVNKKKGEAFLATCRAAWPDPVLDCWAERISERGEAVCYAAAVGAATAQAGIALDCALLGYLLALAANLLVPILRHRAPRFDSQEYSGQRPERATVRRVPLRTRQP